MKLALKISILFFFFILIGGLFVLKQPFVTEKLVMEALQNMEKSSAQSLEKHVKNLSSSERFTDFGLKKARDYILESLEKEGVDGHHIEIQNYTVWVREYQNIIVHFWDHKKRGKKYVVGAHYDGHGELPWADDNASGVAGLIEIARILHDQQIEGRTIQIVFYSTEEMPYFRTKNMWSYKHVGENTDIDLAIILEMIGYFSEEKKSQSFPVSFLKYLYPETGNYIALVSNLSYTGEVRKLKWFFKTSLKKNRSIWVESINAPSFIPGIDFSDHQNYWKFGIPAIMVTDTAFYRNKNYHTSEDTYEKLDYKKMKEVVDAVVVTILSP